MQCEKKIFTKAFLKFVDGSVEVGNLQENEEDILLDAFRSKDLAFRIGDLFINMNHVVYIKLSR